MNQIITINAKRKIIFIPNKEFAMEILTHVDSLSNSTLIINGELLSPRSASTKLTAAFTKIFAQLRKRDIDVILITNNKVDKMTRFYIDGSISDGHVVNIDCTK